MGVKIRQKTKGKGQPWWVFISHNGQRTSRKVGDKQAAETVASKIRAKLQLGGFSFEDERPVPTFKDYADSWINKEVPAKCKASTAKDYKDILELHVLPVFGDRRVSEITRADIKNFLFNKVNEGKARSTVNHYRAVMSGTLNQAVDAGIIPANPAHKLGRIGRKEEGNGNINPLDKDELKKLLDTVSEYYPQHYPLFLLLARTGMRIGEALGLQWSDIDFNTRSISIQRSLSKGRAGSPKNGKTRTVDMSKQLTETLLRVKAQRAVIPIDEDVQWVFTDTKGNPIDADNWRRRVFTQALRKAKVKRIRIHDLRHGYITLRLNKGDNVVDVANQAGDDVAVVLKTYTHWMPGKQKAEVDALDDMEYTLEVDKAQNED